MREREIEAYFVRRVKEVGGLQRKFVSPGHRGVPDRIVAKDSRIYLVELKAPGSWLRPDQEREHSEWHEVGVATFVISSKDMVDRFIKIHLGEKP